MSEPTAHQLRKLRELLAKADETIASMLETLTDSKQSRPRSNVVPIQDEPIMTGVDQTAWDAYHQHRRAIKAKKLSTRGVRLLALEFAKYPPAAQLAAVDQSIRNGWIGFFPEKVSYLKADRVETMKERLQQWIAESSRS